MPELGFNCRAERDKWRAGGIVESENAVGRDFLTPFLGVPHVGCLLFGDHHLQRRLFALFAIVGERYGLIFC